MEGAPIVLASANKHGVSDEDAIHAWSRADRVYDVGDGVLMYIGADTTGRALEVGVVDYYVEAAIIHAMPARPRYR